jgi:hypothetical protein
MKAEIRIFMSSSISTVLGTLSADEEEFWSRFDEQRVSYFYTMKSAEKDKNGIYFDLFSELHELKPIPLLDEKSSPVEKIMIVSMYDSDMDKRAKRKVLPPRAGRNN